MNRHISAIIQDFPWDFARKIYTIKSDFTGVSFDWEFLLSSAFVDAKCIICEWLRLAKLTKTATVDFEESILTAVDAKIIKLVLARAELFEKHGFFPMISRAFLYMSGIYSEELQLLAVFTSLKGQNSAETAYNVAPNILVLSTWLQESVTLDLQSFPAILLSQLVTTNIASHIPSHSGLGFLTPELAVQMLREHMIKSLSVPISQSVVTSAPAIARATAVMTAAQTSVSSFPGIMQQWRQSGSASGDNPCGEQLVSQTSRASSNAIRDLGADANNCNNQNFQNKSNQASETK